jgi:hypothetical protein
MCSSKNQTVGKIATDLLSQTSDPINIIDIQKEADKEFIKELENIITNHKHYDDVYYIQVILKKEPLLENVIRRYFVVRKSPPLPTYDTSLFSYDNQKEQLFFHWSIPDPTSCHYILTHEQFLPSEEQDLISTVKKFSAGVMI